MTESTYPSEMKIKKKPAYQEVKEDLIRRVLNGEWRPGELVPSEIALAEEYSVSVGTARKAVEQLVQDKLVVRRRGRGTMITSNRGEGTSQPFYFLKFYNAEGERTRASRYIDCEPNVASELDARMLGITLGSPVSVLRRVRMTHPDRADIIERIVLREDFCPQAARLFARDQPTSISSFLDRMYNILIIRVEDQLCAAAADEMDAKYLDVRPGEPVMEMLSTAYDLAGRAIEYRRTHVRRGIYYCNTTK